jgi:hypothetical protein
MPAVASKPAAASPLEHAGPARPAVVISTLPFTGSPIGAELAAGSSLLVAGMLMARRRRAGART